MSEGGQGRERTGEGEDRGVGLVGEWRGGRDRKGQGREGQEY